MRKLSSFIFGAVLFLVTGWSAFALQDINLQMQLGNPSGATADPNNHNHYLIQRTVEALDYSDNLGEPYWASWDLTASDVGHASRSDNFFQDKSLPAGFTALTTDDYNGVGNIDFDRGHMCPSADRTDTDANNDMVFFMSNIIPQAANNNEGVWAHFEDYCRTQAQAGNELLIVCGPSGFGSTRIPSGKAVIPDYTWKIVVVVPLGSGTAASRITTSNRVIVIKIPNNNSVTANWSNYVTSASQIEVDTGFTFFTALDPGIASVLRTKVDGQTNPPPVIANFSPSSGPRGGSVVITGTNFTGASAITFNGSSASFNFNSATQLTATIPPNATSGLISVTTPNGTALSSSNFIVTGLSVDLAVSVLHNGVFTQGDTADTYSITVANVGSLPSSGVVSVSNSLPPGLIATGISGTGWTADLNSLTCTRSDILTAASSYPLITVTVFVSTNTPATVTNTVLLSGGGDANSANNTASDVTTVLLPPTFVPVTLLGWDVNPQVGGTNNYGPSPFLPTTNAPHLISGGLIRGSGVGTNNQGAVHAWGGNTFTSTSSGAAIGANQFFTFNVMASAGYTMSLYSISEFDYRRSGSGPANGLLQYQLGAGGFADITTVSYPSNTSAGGTLLPINLSGIAALQNIGPGTNVTFRIVNWGATSSAGTWYISDVSNSTAMDFVIKGNVSPVLTPVESWRVQYFGTSTNTGEAADTAVSSTDGMPNLLKYAFGLNPFIPAANPMAGDISNDHLRVTLPKNPAATDVSFHVEITSDLSQPFTTNGLSIDQNTSTLLQVHDDTAVSSGVGSRFMRLRVSRP